MARREGLCRLLMDLFLSLESTFDPKIDQSALCEIGVDTRLVDLDEETENEGVYFRPMPQDRFRMLGTKPEPKFSFHWPRDHPSMADAYRLFDKICSQIYDSDPENGSRPYEQTAWEPECIEDSPEENLGEFEGMSDCDPTSRHDWKLVDVLETPHHPHRTCISCHAVPNAIGPIRSELMILIGMMFFRMSRNEEEFMDDDTFPVSPRPLFKVVIKQQVFKLLNQFFGQKVLMISVIGREARLVQAHIAPEEQRIKVRYSQLFDFDFCRQQETLDLFARWLLSDPRSADMPSSSEEDESPEVPPTAASEAVVPMKPAPEFLLTLRTGRSVDASLITHLTNPPHMMTTAAT